jgi:transglutaminase-like putative cysteine protease
MNGVTRRRIVWANADAKAQWIDGMAYTDAKLPLVRDFAARCAFAFDPNDREGLARTLQRFVRDAIRYVPDPTYEEISDSQTILERAWGDCDDKARLFTSLARAVSLDARVRPVHDEEGLFYHVQCEVRWPGSERMRNVQPGGWVLVELILRDCDLGDSPAMIPCASNGSRVLQ